MTGDDEPDPDRAAEMTAHDALPEQVRRLLHDAPVHVPTEVVATCLRIGMKPARAVEVSVPSWPANVGGPTPSMVIISRGAFEGRHIPEQFLGQVFRRERPFGEYLMRPMRAIRAALLLAVAALAGCATPVETPAEAQARRAVSCEEVGFTRDSPDFRLCLLLQQTNERIEAVERRLRSVELDTRFPGPFHRHGWW